MSVETSKPGSDAGSSGAPASAHLFPLFGHGIVGRLRLAHATAGAGLQPLTRLQSLKWWFLDNARRPLCLLIGCRFEAPVFQSNRLYFCARCTREMFGRTFADLEPASLDEDDRWCEELQ